MIRKALFFPILPIVIFLFTISVLFIRLLLAWNEIPSSMVIHFDYSGVPNHSVSRVAFMGIMLGVLLVNLIAYFPLIQPRRSIPAYLLQIFSTLFYFLILCSGYIFWELIDYNLYGTPIELMWLLVPAILTLILVIIFATKSDAHKSDQATGGKILFEERHKPSVVGLFTLIFLPGVIAVAILDRWEFFILISFVFIFLISLFACGFVYKIQQGGIGIHAFWWRSMFIPFQDIESLYIKKCSPLKDFGGWGIRYGLGGKAYIWGGKEVLGIKIKDRVIYLGCENPEKLKEKLSSAMGEIS